MKKLLVTAVATAVTCLLVPSVSDAEITSLRGNNSLDANAQAFETKRVVTQKGGFKRSWKLQPPGIPHEISKERINLEENTCMRCHSEETYKKEKAPRVGDSHYLDASGKVQKEVNGRRYFCSVCHAVQVDAAPLVENEFAGQ